VPHPAQKYIRKLTAAIVSKLLILYITDSNTCSSVTENRTHCCISMATLSRFFSAFTAIFIQVKCFD
jgi:hypothetical protein